MTKHIVRETTKLKRDVLALGALVEESLYRAVKCVFERNGKVAEVVVSSDDEIDKREVDLEEECLKVLALNQPTGNDLRMIIAVIKMTNELERIADQAVNIANKAQELSYLTPIPLPPSLEEMAKKTKVILRRSLEALVNSDVRAAWEVLKSDSAIDAMNSNNLEWLQEQIQANPLRTEALLCLLAVSRNLERVADHATNIAEDVIYIVDGEIVRHGRRTQAQSDPKIEKDS